MHRILIAATAGLLMTSAAVAQDGYDWTGFYAGVLGGYGAGSGDVMSTLLQPDRTPYKPGGTTAFDASGFLGGLRVGGDFQVDQFVIGVEGQYALTNIESEFNFDSTRPEAMAGGTLTSLASIRAKAGVSFDSTLLYGTVGYATAHNESWANNVWSVAPAVDVATGSGQVHGFVVGVGVEQALTDNVSLTANYDYYSFARGSYDMTSSAYPTGAVLQSEPVISLGTITAGLNFRF